MRVLPHVRSWEWFTITVVAERKVTLLTHHGSYVVAAADGAVTHERLHEVQPRALWRVIKSATSPSEFELSNEIYEEGMLSVSYEPQEDGPKKVTCKYADRGPPLYTPWTDAKGMLAAAAAGEVSAEPPAASPRSPPPPPSGEAAIPPPPEIRRNAATGSVVVIAPERLARLKGDPFRRAGAPLLDRWPIFDEEGGERWKAEHPETFAALVALATRATARGPAAFSAVQDALLLRGDEPPGGLPLGAKGAGPYVARLVAARLPEARRSRLGGAARSCPFCAKCRPDIPAPGELVNLDVCLLSGGGAGRGLGVRAGVGAAVASVAVDEDHPGDEDQGGVDDLWLEAVLESADATAATAAAADLRRRSCTWIARNIEQRFPTMRQLPGAGAGAAHASAAGGLHQSWAGAGVHELFLESPRHNASFGSCMSLAEVYGVLLLWTRRYRAIRDANHLPFAMIFKNSGDEAGATQQHPHSQLIGFPVVPSHTKTCLACARTFHEVNGACVYCRMARRLRAPSSDRASGRELVVYGNEFFVAFCPWAPPCDYAVYVMPWEHHADFLLDAAPTHALDGTNPRGTARQTSLAALADCLRVVSRKLYAYCGNPDYNLVVRNPPFAERSVPWFHWHIEIAPIFSKKGGLEYGTHCMVLMTPPEVAARNLRETNVGE